MTSESAARGAPVVVCDAVTRVHGAGDTRRAAVEQASCRVGPGARVALTGPSGSGKSTLLHLMAGLDSPTSGHVRWPGLPDGRPGALGGAAMVFQGPSLVPELTVAENVALPLLVCDGAPDRGAVTEVLARTGLADRLANLPDELSGGQLQRAALARTIVVRPRLILADEPTGQLDRATGEAMLTLLLASADEIGAAVVIASHDPWVAARLDQRWTMRDGALAATGRVAPRERTG